MGQRKKGLVFIVLKSLLKKCKRIRLWHDYCGLYLQTGYHRRNKTFAREKNKILNHYTRREISHKLSFLTSCLGMQ